VRGRNHPHPASPLKGEEGLLPLPSSERAGVRGKTIRSNNAPGLHMKICDITQFYSPVSGGVKRYLHGKIDFLRRKTDHHHLLIVPGPRDSESGDERFRVVEIRSSRIPGTFSYRLLLRRRKIRQALERERPDIIEVGDSYQVAWYATGLGRRLGIPVVAFYHSDYPRALEDGVRRRLGRVVSTVAGAGIQPYMLRLFGRMEATLVASERMHHILSEYGIPSLRLAPMGVDTRRFRPSEDRRSERDARGIPSDRILVLYAGRLSADKNTKSLLDMISLLNPGAEKRFHLAIAGDGPQRELFQREATRRSDIAWLGYIQSDDEMAGIYSAADMTIHPGTRETYGLTVLESQACGTPAISVRSGGTDELNLAGEQFLAESGSAEVLAECVRRAISLIGPDLRDSLAQRIGGRFDSDRCFAREIDIYEEIVDRFRERRTRKHQTAGGPSGEAVHRTTVSS
jgi:alpha-1,6-mannosyltransferase